MRLILCCAAWAGTQKNVHTYFKISKVDHFAFQCCDRCYKKSSISLNPSLQAGGRQGRKIELCTRRLQIILFYAKDGRSALEMKET
jgi:hypothetical protein